MTKYLVYNMRKRAEGGDTASEYFNCTRNVAGRWLVWLYVSIPIFIYYVHTHTHSQYSYTPLPVTIHTHIGITDTRFQALMPDSLHWLGITKIDRYVFVSCSGVLCVYVWYMYMDFCVSIQHHTSNPPCPYHARF